MANYYLSGYTTPERVSSKEDVKALQRELNAGGANLKVDGIWGPKTDAAYANTKTGAATQTSAADALAQGLTAYMQSLETLLAPPHVSYKPQSNGVLKAQIAESLRPGVNAAIASRKEQTDFNRAELDADAYARGMGSSTYLTDMKDRQLQYEADDVAALEGNYAATLAKLLMDAIQNENARAADVDKYNASAQSEYRKLLFSVAQSAYAQQLQEQAAAAAAAAKKSSTARSSKRSSKRLSEADCYSFLSALTPKSRSAIYSGQTAQDRQFRDELIQSLGKSGYLQAQAYYPGA